MTQLHHSQQKCALVMAGGTGGHIFPGLAVAMALREQGWRVHWLGGSGNTMEARLVPPQDIPFEAVSFSGVRGKGLKTLLTMPWRLCKAMVQSWCVLRRVRPDVVLGLGGYITVPAGIISVLSGKPLILHEQNAVAGLSNKILAIGAKRVLSTFPDVLPRATWIGNPLRTSFTQCPPPAERFEGRSGPLRILVLGGSLGAGALNTLVPDALALIPEDQRPHVTHQSGAQHIEVLRARYAQNGVTAQTMPFIDNVAQAMSDADLIVCRAGASTVTEIAAIGAAALFIPFPYAVDDHQTRNAAFLVSNSGAWLMQQRDLTPQILCSALLTMNRPELLSCAENAYRAAKRNATENFVRTCEEVIA